MWMKGSGDAMKYIKQPKRYIVLDDFEWRHLSKVSTSTASKSSTKTAVERIEYIISVHKKFEPVSGYAFFRGYLCHM